MAKASERFQNRAAERADVKHSRIIGYSLSATSVVKNESISTNIGLGSTQKLAADNESAMLDGELQEYCQILYRPIHNLADIL